MARKTKRPRGSGEVLRGKNGFEIRWREPELQEDGTVKRVRKFEAVGLVSREQAESALAKKLERVRKRRGVYARPGRTFKDHATYWEKNILPMKDYKHSTRKEYSYTLTRQLVPQFGDCKLDKLSTKDIQDYVSVLSEQGRSRHTIRDYVKVLKVVLDPAQALWKCWDENPARSVTLPPPTPLKEKWALTAEQAGQLIASLPIKQRAMVALAIGAGLRRGEILEARWMDLQEGDAGPIISITRAVYDGVVGTPKTPKSVRKIPVSTLIVEILNHWKSRSNRTGPEYLMFGTRTGKPESGNNVLRRFVFPACKALGWTRRPTWQTFRRTYSTWLDQHQVPLKDVAEMMGHVDVGLHVREYSAPVVEAQRKGAEKIGDELASFIGQFEDEMERMVRES